MTDSIKVDYSDGWWDDNEEPKLPPSMADWWATTEDKVEWLVTGWLAVAAITWLSGQQKLAWKTWTADAFAILAATGTNWDMWEFPRPLKVLYIQEEGQRAQTKQRHMALLRGFGIDPDHDGFSTNLRFAFQAGFKLDDPDSANWACSLIETHEFDVVILDSFVFMHDANENAVSELKPAVDTIKMMRKLGASPIGLVHLKKPQEKFKTKTGPSDGEVNFDDEMRGSGLLANSYDHHWAPRRYVDSGRKRTITGNKIVETIGMPFHLRHRGGSPDQFWMKWEVHSRIEGKEKIAEKAWFRLRPLKDDEVVSVRPDVLACMRKLGPGFSYTRFDLERLWHIDTEEAEWVISEAMKGGKLVSVGDSEWARVLRKPKLRAPTTVTIIKEDVEDESATKDERGANKEVPASTEGQSDRGAVEPEDGPLLRGE